MHAVVKSLLAFALTVPLVAGCASIMNLAPDRDPGTRPVFCDDNELIPALDFTGGASVGLVTWGAFSIVAEMGGNPEGILIIGGIATIGYIVSGVIGLKSVRRCQRYNRSPTPPDPAVVARARARADAWRLTKVAQSAARAGDCATVHELDAKIGALDLELHEVVFARDVAVARCLAP